MTEDGRLPETAVGYFCIDIVRGLTYLHSNSLAIGDLCPDKVVHYTVYCSTVEITQCSKTSLIRTPGDHQNPFVVSGIRINRCNLY